MVNRIKFACATDDQINFSKEHFGSAKKYLIYSLNLDNGEIQFLREIQNLTPEEKIHGDPMKARAVSDVLSGVQILINSFFGPNIVRMRKKFLIIISKENNIKKSLEEINKMLDKLKLLLNQTDNNVLYINKLGEE